MPNLIVVKHESFPKRCEVCHQADFFNPKTNHCARCKQISRKFQNLSHLEQKSTLSIFQVVKRVLAIGGGSFLGFVLHVEMISPTGGPCNPGSALLIIPIFGFWCLIFILGLVVFRPRNSSK
jgi:hypothetical protein